MNIRALVAGSVIVIASGIAACTGGGGGSSDRPPALPPPLATTTPLSGQTATLTIMVPRTGTQSAERSARFVSSNSATMKITVITVDGNAPTARRSR